MRRTALPVTALMIFVIWALTSLTPELAIRKTIFLRGDPVQALTVDIAPTPLIDPHYGQQFIVEAYMENVSHEEVHYFYMKRSFVGWYVRAYGSGP